MHIDSFSKFRSPTILYYQPLRDWNFDGIFHAIFCSSSTILPVKYNVSSKFLSNSEVIASELLEDLEDMYRRYYIHSYIITYTVI